MFIVFNEFITNKRLFTEIAVHQCFILTMQYL